MVQSASHLHDQISKAVCGQAQDIFDNPTPFDPRKHVFHHHTRTGDEGIEELILHAQGLALRFFFGCRLRTPSGSSPCKPVSLSSVAWTGEAIWASAAACLSCGLPTTVGPREITVLVVSFTKTMFLSVGVCFLPLSCSLCWVASGGRWRRRSV